MLTDAAIRALKADSKPYKRADGGGLFISVQVNGTKLWRLKYRFRGKEKLLSGGKFPSVGLAAARAWRDQVKAQIAADVDPSEARREDNREKRAAAANTFRALADEWLAAMAPHWGARYQRRISRYFADDVYPVIGDRAVGSIKPADIIDMVRRMEKRGVRETAHRVRALVGKVFRYGIANHRATSDPTESIADAQKRVPPVTHRARVQATEMPAFFERLRKDGGDSITHLALRWTIHTMVRTNETRFAEHAEIDTEKALWRIPASRMKMKVEHVVPLSPQALEIYRQICALGLRGKYLFPMPGTRLGVISENRMLDVMYRQGYRGKATVHGFRGLASTVLNEQLRDDEAPMFHKDWIERQLAHVEGNQVRAAYNAAEWLGPRKRMMAWWSDWLDQQEAIGDLLG